MVRFQGHVSMRKTVVAALLACSSTASADTIPSSFYCLYSETPHDGSVYYRVSTYDWLWWDKPHNSEYRSNDLEFECSGHVHKSSMATVYNRLSNMTMVANELTNSSRRIVGAKVNGGPLLEAAQGKSLNNYGWFNTFNGSDLTQEETFVFQSLRQLSTASQHFNVLFKYDYGMEEALYFRDAGMAEKAERERKEYLASRDPKFRSLGKEMMPCAAAFTKLLKVCMSIRSGVE